MPLKLNVGVSKKGGLPEYSNVGATCNLEVEWESGLLDDLEVFHEQVRDAYVACHPAVNDALARLQGQPVVQIPVFVASDHEHSHCNGSHDRTDGGPARNDGGRGRSSRPATPGQVRALVAIARNQHADLDGLLRDKYGAGRPEELTLSQASALIGQLRAVSTA